MILVWGILSQNNFAAFPKSAEVIQYIYKMIKVLITDDHKVFRDGIISILEGEKILK